jgi:hypothetical protein
MLDIVKPDLLVMAGCILNTNLSVFREVLDKRKKTPLVFLGAGSPLYENKYQKKVGSLLTEINPDVLISRDSVARNKYKNNFKLSYDGIDCGFFVNDCLSPAASSTKESNLESYAAATFHKIKEPEIQTNLKIIRPMHTPLTYRTKTFWRGLLQLVKNNFIKRDKGYLLAKKNLFLSDSVLEYLYLYKNAQEVYSDMVHACVAALSFQTPCRFYYKTPRAYLFERMGLKHINKRLSTLDSKRLEAEKEEQISALKNMVNRL